MVLRGEDARRVEGGGFGGRVLVHRGGCGKAGRVSAGPVTLSGGIGVCLRAHFWQLKDELAARGEARSGLKYVLKLRTCVNLPYIGSILREFEMISYYGHTYA